ncbi:MAG: UDP-N-acetylmuramoyl-L-alanine--D-glutamate ligase, partial [Bacteroidota bacterium]
TQAKIIAITGTNGKTTTTLLTYHLLKEAGFNVGVGGNIGNSFAAMVVDDVYDYYVLEISSFQLDDIETFKPYLSMILNITPDHLDRYDHNMNLYADAKFRIAKNQSAEEVMIAGVDSPMIRERLEKLADDVQVFRFSKEAFEGTGASLVGSELVFRMFDGEEVTIPADVLPLYGRHNRLNALAAISAALIVGVEGNQVVEGLRTFRNAAHRMELIATVNGVQYINDSKATNVDAVYYALEGIEEPIVWIAGGVDKGNDYEQIALLVEQKVSHLIGLGTDNEALTDFFSNRVSSGWNGAISECRSMQSAVAKATAAAEEGMVVLLSPACASFDLFKNYMDRGDQFRAEVMELARQKEKIAR